MSEPIPESPSPVNPPGFLAQMSAWFRDRINGFAEFIGMLIGMIGYTSAQLVFAIGLACLAGGFGASLEMSHRGPFWMFVGALLVGLSVPLKRK